MDLKYVDRLFVHVLDQASQAVSADFVQCFHRPYTVPLFSETYSARR